jgi:DNA-3-methyladenine glycosylase II
MTDPIDYLCEDPALAPLVDRHGPLSIEPAPNPFERFVVAIVNQQLSTESAAAIRERLFERFMVTPETMRSADEAALREVGLSSQKVAYVRNVAAAFQSGKVDVDRYASFSDAEVIEDLTDIKGVGDWTAKMFVMFVLGREDVFPVEDLGIRKGMAAVCNLPEDDRPAMVERAEMWRPYRSYASRYLWLAVD